MMVIGVIQAHIIANSMYKHVRLVLLYAIVKDGKWYDVYAIVEDDGDSYSVKRDRIVYQG